VLSLEITSEMAVFTIPCRGLICKSIGVYLIFKLTQAFDEKECRAGRQDMTRVGRCGQVDFISFHLFIFSITKYIID